jgi:hypothetical protein
MSHDDHQEALVQRGQLSLLPPPDPGRDEIGKFHGPQAGAPETERQAAAGVYPRSGTKRLAVLAALAGAGQAGLTDFEGAAETGIYLYTYAPRRVELLDDGWLEDSGLRRPTSSGKMAAVWRLSPQGRHWLAERGVEAEAR